MANISPIIQAPELVKLYGSENLIIADVSNGKNAKPNYEAKHLEGAIFVDLNAQLADIKEDFADGGRHPLPDVQDFVETLGKLGISPESHVIIYDDAFGGNAAARFWWMLSAVGHEMVQVLNGGMKAAIEAGFPVSVGQEIPKEESDYSANDWNLEIAEMQEVEVASESGDQLIIDVRSAERYRGETEPIDLVAGHIPGAINVPFTENLDENGLFLSPETLKEKYDEIIGDIDTNNVIVHCGSGVTACHTLLAISYAGLEIPKLYVGSWSEWSRNGKPMATQKEH